MNIKDVKYESESVVGRSTAGAMLHPRIQGCRYAHACFNVFRDTTDQRSGPGLYGLSWRNNRGGRILKLNMNESQIRLPAPGLRSCVGRQLTTRELVQAEDLTGV